MQSIRSVFSAVAVSFALTAAPLSAQSVEGVGFFSSGGMTSSAVADGVAIPLVVSLATAGAEGRLAPIGRSSSVDASRRALVAPAPQSEEGGFPWLQVGIGAGVAALFVSAVLTANSGDSAELPRGGISVVLPGT